MTYCLLYFIYGTKSFISFALGRNFVPNALNGEFVTLLGLEEAVKCIVDNDARAKGQSMPEVIFDIFYNIVHLLF